MCSFVNVLFQDLALKKPEYSIFNFLEYQRSLRKTEVNILGLDDGNDELEETVYNIFKKRFERLLEGSYGNSFFYAAVRTNWKLKISISIDQLQNVFKRLEKNLEHFFNSKIENYSKANSNKISQEFHLVFYTRKWI